MMMFKQGDDYRQDGLILQLFGIMDSLLNNVGLEMGFTLYNLLAHTIDDGLHQFTPNSATVTDIRNKYKTRSLETYLRETSKDNEELYNK